MTEPLLLPEAPGAKASRHCGVWALVLLLFFFPASVVLAIIAIVQNSKARSLARSAPQSYRVPGNAGMILGILSLVALPLFLALVGIISAIAIPALLGQRNRARDKAALSNLSVGLQGLSERLESGAVQGKAESELHGEMERQLRESGAGLHNPWNLAGPAFDYRISVVQGEDEEGIRETVRSHAGVLGQSSFVVQFPVRGKSEPHPGFLAAAVKTRNPMEDGVVAVRVLSLD